MKTLYELLEKKSFDMNLRDKEVYFNIDESSPYSYTYFDLFNMVNRYIKIFQGTNLENQKKYLIVDNSIDSIAIFIALLYCGAIPVLLNKRDTVGNILDDYNKEFKFDYFEEFKSYPYDYIVANDNGSFVSKETELIKVKNYIDSISNNDENNGFIGKNKFYICTSGTTLGNPKIVLIDEVDLINKVREDFKDTYGYSYYSYNSIASISGIVFNVVLPIVLDNKLYFYANEYSHEGFRNLFNEVSKYKINHLMLPRNILDYLPDSINELEFNSLKKIYLGGEINYINHINRIRQVFPKINDNVFVNSYGSTETYGKICECSEVDLKPLYIHQLSFLNNNFIYTYDKKNVFSMNNESINSQTKLLSKKIDIKYVENDFFEVLPVSSDVVPNLQINKRTDLIGEILVNNKKIGDIGFYFDNKLYLLGRISDIATLDDKDYFLPSIEDIFGNIIGYKTSAIKDSVNNKILLLVSYKIDRTITNNFKRIIPIVEKCHELIKYFPDIPLEGPLFIDSDKFPKNNLLKKTKKVELSDFSKVLPDFNYNINFYNEVLVSKVKYFLKEITNKEVSVNLNNGFIIINKQSVTIDDVIELLKYIGYTDFNETDDYFSFNIDDSILFDISNSKYVRLENINYLKKKQSECEDFIDYFNRFLNRKKHYVCLRFLGTYQRNNKKIVFVPFQITSSNTHGEYEVLVGRELPNISENSGIEIEMIYLETAQSFYYNDEELSLKLNEYEKYLYHEYKMFIDAGRFFVDDIECEKKSNFLFDLLEKHGYKFSAFPFAKEERYDFIVNDITYAVTNKFIFDVNLYFLIIDCLYDIDVFGYNDRRNNVKGSKLGYLADYLFQFYSQKLMFENPIIVIYNVEYMRENNNKLTMMINNEKLKVLESVIEEIKKIPNRIVYINGEKKVFDFSKFRLVYLINDKDLYENPSINKMMDLGYYKCLCDRSDVNIIKIDSDVIRKIKM